MLFCVIILSAHIFQKFLVDGNPIMNTFGELKDRKNHLITIKTKYFVDIFKNADKTMHWSKINK